MNTFARVIGSALTALALIASPPSHGAEFTPQKPIRFIVPALAGASNDVAARAIARELARMWKQPVIIDNRPGGGTTIGARTRLQRRRRTATPLAG